MRLQEPDSEGAQSETYRDQSKRAGQAYQGATPLWAHLGFLKAKAPQSSVLGPPCSFWTPHWTLRPQALALRPALAPGFAALPSFYSPHSQSQGPDLLVALSQHHWLWGTPPQPLFFVRA